MAAAVPADPVPTLAGVRRRRSGTLVAGLVIIGTLVLLAVAASVIVPHDPVRQDLGAALQGPSAEHWLGTDQLGRDVLARLLHAARLDLRIAALSVLAALVIGGVLGGVAGYFGRWAEMAIMRVADVISSIPTIILMLAMVFVLGQRESALYIAIASIGWVAYARIVRAEVIVARDQEYVLAARAGGLSNVRVLFRHILPNVLTQAIAFAMLDVVNVIALIVFVGYLGLGVQPPTPEWGAMIADGQTLLQTNWQLTTFPGVMVVLTGLGFALAGDGLQDLRSSTR
jgi:peptide/nickel transport system permease protein